MLAWIADQTPADFMIQGGQYIGFSNPKTGWNPVSQFGPGRTSPGPLRGKNFRFKPGGLV